MSLQHLGASIITLEDEAKQVSSTLVRRAWYVKEAPLARKMAASSTPISHSNFASDVCKPDTHHQRQGFLVYHPGAVSIDMGSNYGHISRHYLKQLQMSAMAD